MTWLTVEANSPLVKLRTTVANAARDHRLRVLFPTGIHCAVSHAEAQFDVVARSIVPPRGEAGDVPDRIREIIVGAREAGPITTFPQRTFVDLDDGRRGLAVLNRGLPEYEVLPEQSTIALTLFRAVGWIAKPHLQTRIGDAGPMIAVPGAQCLREMTFDYAILAHRGDWQAGDVAAYADRFNRQLLAVETGVHPGTLGETGGWLQLDAPSWLRATAIKQSEDGRALIVRLHNLSDTPTCGVLRSSLKISRASSVSLGEEEREHLPIQDGHAVLVTAGPKRIVTVRLEAERRAGPLRAGGQAKVIREAAGIAPAPPVEEGLELSLAQAELARETERAAELASRWAKARAALQASAAGAALRRLQLDEATSARAALEARLSATLLEKAVLRAQPVTPATQERLSQVEAALREIGDALNLARVRKRALEYIVGCDGR